MKKFCLMFIVACLPLLVQAQKKVGTLTLYPRIGLNWSKFSGDKIFTDASSSAQSSVDAKYRAGFTAGAELQYQWDRNVAVSGGVLYSRGGTKFDNLPDDFDDSGIKTDNIQVPILLVGTTSFGLSGKIGLQPEYCFHTNVFKDYIRKVNLSLPVGLAYEWHDIAIDARYNFGLTKVYKNDLVPSSHNDMFVLTLGCGFDL